MSVNSYTHCKVFSATMHKERDALGDRVTEFIAKTSGIDIEDTVVAQSSDNQFHCLSITLFYSVKR